MFGQIKLAITIMLVVGIAGAGVYVMKLRSDNAILQANQVKLEESITEQKSLLENQKKDFEQIMKANSKMNELVNNLQKDLDLLDKKFNKGSRDFGKLALERTKAIERVMNNASKNAMRCLEIASGSQLTEKEINATKKSEINPECPSIANPNYISY